jgi:biotin synthase-related radical SAM superfamily protein
MVKQTEVVEVVLKELGVEKLAIADAVAKAEAIKPLKNKNKVKNWENHFKTLGTVVDGFVTAKVVATPAPEVPKAEPAKIV